MKTKLFQIVPFCFLLIWGTSCRKEKKKKVVENSTAPSVSRLNLIWSGQGQGVIWPSTCSSQGGFASLLSYLGKIQGRDNPAKVVIGGDSLVINPQKPALGVNKYYKLLEILDKYGVNIFVPGQSELALVSSPETDKIKMKSHPRLLQLQLFNLQKSFHIFQQGELKIALVSLITKDKYDSLPEIWEKTAQAVKTKNPHLIIGCFSMEREDLDKILKKLDSPPDLVFLTGKTGKAQLEYKLGKSWVFRTSGGFSSAFKFTFVLKSPGAPFLFLNEREQNLQKQKRLTRGLNNLNRILKGELEKQRRKIFWKRRKALKKELNQTEVVLQKFNKNKKKANTFKMDIIALQDLHIDHNVEQLLLREGFEQKTCNN